MPQEYARKPREKPSPYTHKPGPKGKRTGNQTKTSARPAASNKRDNLTLHDWMTVLAYVDDHPSATQASVVEHFKSRSQGALLFSQSALSRKVKDRNSLEERVQSNPSALSSKRPRAVTNAEVERALVLWVRHMEGKRETVNGPMLVEKRKRFEAAFDVPESHRLSGTGWIASFCKTYHIKEYRRHGEAASVNLVAVEKERVRIREILAKFALRDRLNFDETSLFAFAPPDRGLASEQMSGKKSSKFRITLGFACNADGSEKFPPIYIGKSKRPRCFKKKTPAQYGFYYRNNKKAWMTAVLFEEWLKDLDLCMRKQNRHVCLLLDNFSGHTAVAYKPQNVEVVFFEPNLTAFVQPLDAGIIRCFKAHYRRGFCARALDLDDAGEREIYKIDLLEAMLMAKAAWDAVDSTTIRNCWNHTAIQRDAIMLRIPSLHTRQDIPPLKTPNRHSDAKVDPTAWKILHDFAITNMSLPQAELALQKHLGDRYVDEDWRDALKAGMIEDENTEGLAVAAIENMRLTVISLHNPTTSSPVPTPSLAMTQQSNDLEKDLAEAVTRLKERNRIFGKVPTLAELLDPMEERVVGESEFVFEGGIEEIVAQVYEEKAIAEGRVIEIDDSDSEDEPDGSKPAVGVPEMLQMCQLLEKAALDSGVEGSLDLSQSLRRFRARLVRVELKEAKQTMLDKMWTKS